MADAASRQGYVDHRARGRDPRHLQLGWSTAVPGNVTYRLDKLRAHGLLNGEWLDCGCAEGGYAIALAEAGAERVVGIDVQANRVAQAQRALEQRSDSLPVRFEVSRSERLPFADEVFDRVLLNEVLEHVENEEWTLAEIWRVLRPNGYLALISPNRWFPFEGHGARLGRWSTGLPVPFLPWLPTNVTKYVAKGRNYWPRELVQLAADAGFDVVSTQSIFPAFEVYPWLPAPLTRWYRKELPRLERLPFVRRFGVSTLVVGRKVVAESRESSTGAGD